MNFNVFKSNCNAKIFNGMNRLYELIEKKDHAIFINKKKHVYMYKLLEIIINKNNYKYAATNSKSVDLDP